MIASVKPGALVRLSSLATVAFLAIFACQTFIIAGRAEGDGSGLRSAVASDPRVASIAVKLLARSTATMKTAYNGFKAQSSERVEPASVGSTPAVHLANISTRLAVGTGNNVLIGGFIVTGTQPKKILLRGIGPSLPVNENLADPTLELHDSSGAIVAASDDWRDTQQDELQATTIPPGNDYESAIVASVNPGAYTAVLAGKGGTTGVGVVEVYDLDLTVDSKLANISTRGFVDQGDNVLIGGTIVVGSGPTDVLFRAIGPSLPGIANALQDPTLELHDSQGNIIASNDNWQDSQADAIQGTTIPPSDPREAAILRQLTPGAYTAIVQGKNNTTGVAVVEAYQLD